MQVVIQILCKFKIIAIGGTLFLFSFKPWQRYMYNLHLAVCGLKYNDCKGQPKLALTLVSIAGQL
jgi:hypothetical protein